jgi:hypothetical protein
MAGRVMSAFTTVMPTLRTPAPAPLSTEESTGVE